jgi:hypothetical protein
MLEINTQDNSGLISLSHASRLSGYHQDYLGQLCRAGKLPASKVGRNWFTSKEAVQKLATSEISTPEVNSTESEPNDFIDDALYANSINESLERENELAVAQPVITQSITISKVDGIPIAIQTVEVPTQNTNRLQGVLTNMRIQALQEEVFELREMLNRLMTEVTAHARMLQAQNVMHNRDDRLQHSYVPNLDFGLSRSNYVNQKPAPQLRPYVEESFEIIFEKQPQYPFATWLAATAALVALVYIAVGIFAGSFLGNKSPEVSTIYYHNQNQELASPQVAGDTTTQTNQPEMLPTGPALETGQNMIQ